MCFLIPKTSFISLCTLALVSMGSCVNTPSTCIDPARINPDGICTMEYDPVCGCDNKTYSNACVANNAGVTSYTKGACANQ